MDTPDTWAHTSHLTTCTHTSTLPHAHTHTHHTHTLHLSSLPSQVYCYLMACLAHREVSLLVPTLEALVQIIGNAPLELAYWMASPLTTGSAPHNFWKEDYKSLGGEQSGEESYFVDDHTGDGDSKGGDGDDDAKVSSAESSEEMLSSGVRGPGIAKRVMEVVPPIPLSCLPEHACLVAEGPPIPIDNLCAFIQKQVLANAKVSVQSLGLAALTAAVTIRPATITDLSCVRPFVTASDPKLRGNLVKLMASLVSSELRAARGEASQCRPLIDEACDLIQGTARDDTPVVLKALCEALQVCLPVMTSSSSPKRAIALLRSVLPLSSSPYWLTKVELLQTLSPVEYTSLAAADPTLPHIVLHGIVLPLLSDTDHRVRGAACEALVSLVPRLKLTPRWVLAHAQREAARAFSHLLSSTAQLTMAGIQDTKSKHRPEHPLCLDEVLDYLLHHLSCSLDQTLQKGCLEALHALVVHYPPATLPSAWGCDALPTPCTALQLSLSLLTGSKLSWSIQGHIEVSSLSPLVILLFK